MFNRISHIGVVVNDMEEALRIWQDKLGFKQFSEAHFDVEGWLIHPKATSGVMIEGIEEWKEGGL